MATPEVRFVVPGKWQPERKRQVSRGTWTRRVDNPECLDAKTRIGVFARQAYHGPAIDVPCRLRATWRKPKPKGYRKRDLWPYKRPDLTNLLKLLEDALQDVGVLADDSLVCEQVTRKEWGDREEVEVCIEPLEEEQQ